MAGAVKRLRGEQGISAQTSEASVLGSREGQQKDREGGGNVHERRCGVDRISWTGHMGWDVQGFLGILSCFSLL